MTKKREELFGPDAVENLIEIIEAKHSYKSISVILSEEEWSTLSQVSIVTGLTKTMIFRMALDQLLRDIVARKQKNKKYVPIRVNEIKSTKKIKTCYCSINIPVLIHNTIVSYAKKNGLKAYEAYSGIIDEFLKFAENTEKPLLYRECPQNSTKRSISIFTETTQRIKILKQRDKVTEYSIVYNAVLRFLEKNNLLPELTHVD